MRIRLEKLVQTALLQTFHVILHLIVQGKFELVEVDFIAGGNCDDLIVIEKLCLTDLLGELRVC